MVMIPVSSDAEGERVPVTQISEADLHKYVISFGKHKGERLVHVPVAYLKWMVKENTRDADLAAAELKRRGTPKPSNQEIDISGHAIDRASRLLMSKFWTNAKEEEGLHGWLCRVATEALKSGLNLGDGRVLYNDMKFIFTVEGKWPTLKTVLPKSGKEEEEISDDKH